MTDESQPVEDRYEETPETPPTENDAFAPSETWANYWDVNPIEHGGEFIKWTGDMWKIVEVTPPSAWPEDAYIVSVIWAEPMDVWEDPDDPLTDFTDDMKSILDSLGDDHHLPNAPPLLERITYYVADFTHYIGDHRPDTFEIPEGDVEAYWNEVESYGVDPAEVENVSDSDLPENATDDD
jgi:hypothetical protein